MSLNSQSTSRRVRIQFIRTSSQSHIKLTPKSCRLKVDVASISHRSPCGLTLNSPRVHLTSTPTSLGVHFELLLTPHGTKFVFALTPHQGRCASRHVHLYAQAHAIITFQIEFPSSSPRSHPLACNCYLLRCHFHAPSDEL